MKVNTNSVLKYAALVVGILAIAFLAAMTAKPSVSEPSPECVKLRQDVSASLHVGDSEKDIVPFFKKRGWKHASAPIVGLYSAEIHVRKTLVGSDYSVLISIETKDGRISRIDISDQIRFL